MRNPPSRQAGFTLVEIMVVVVIIGLLLAIAIPNFAKNRTTAQTKTCGDNLLQIESAKQQWALEAEKTNGDIVTDADLFGPTLYLKTKPACPAGGVYTLNPIGINATCSIASHTY